METTETNIANATQPAVPTTMPAVPPSETFAWSFWITMAIGAVVLAVITTIVQVLVPDWSNRQEQVDEIQVIDATKLGRVALLHNQTKELQAIKLDLSPEEKVHLTLERYENIPQGHKDTAHFYLKNVGEGDLTLTPDKPSCTCTDSFFVEPREVRQGDTLVLASGEQAKFAMVWESKDAVGLRLVRAPVKTDDPYHREVVFEVHMVVRPEVVTNRLEVNFGEFSETASPKENLYVYSTHLDGVAVTKASCELTNIQATIHPMTTEELEQFRAKSGSRLEVGVLPGLPVGYFSTPLNISLQGAKLTEMVIPVGGYLQGRITYTPRRLDFQVVGIGEEKSAKIILTADLEEGVTLDKENLIIEGLPEGMEQPLRLELTQPSKRFLTRYQLTATTTPNIPSGSFLGSIVVKDTKGVARIRIPFHGLVAEGGSSFLNQP